MPGMGMGWQQIRVVLRRRLIQVVPVIALIMVCNFLLLHLAPGDVVDTLVANAGGADEAYLRQLRVEYGLDQPLVVQLARYMWRLARFDLGYSFVYNQPVVVVILDRLLATVLLMVAALGFAFVLGIVLGVTAARRVNSLADNLISVAGLLFYATPSFWVALMMIVVLTVKLGWLPLAGLETVASPYAGVARFWDIFQHLVMPTLSLALVFVAIYMRLMRTSVLEVSALDFVRTARAKGVSEFRVAYRHILRNALLPMVTMLGLQFGTLLGSSVVVETVFSLPGMGRLAFDSVLQRDFTTLLGIVFLSSILVIVVNVFVDFIYMVLDPRVDLG